MVRKDCDTTTVQHHVRGTHAVVTAGVVLCLCAGTVHGDAVVLWPQATVTTEDITLGDVARLDGFSAAEGVVMSGIVIGPAPAPGTTGEISLADVRTALRSGGANLAHLSLKGALACTIRRPVSAPAGPAPRGRQDAPAARTLGERIRGAIAEALGGHGVALELVYRDQDRALLDLAEPLHTFDVDPVAAGRLGLLSIGVRIRRGEEPPQQHYLRVTARLRLDVVVAARPINRQQRVQREDIVVETRVFERLDRVGIARPADVIGQETRRAIHVGDVMRVADLKPSMLVEKNDLVGIVALSPGIRLECTAKALDSGTLGEVIEVRNEASGQTYRARIVGLRRAEVVLQAETPRLADGGGS